MAKIGCPLCIHNHFDGTCTAFPIEIPLVFASGEKAHTEPMFDQDNPEIVFQRGTPEQLRALAEVAIAKARQPAY